MGDMADMMLDGTLDAFTGEYIGKGGGYPRTKDGSLPWERNHDNNPKSGVTKWLNNNGVTDKQKQMRIIRLYVKDSTHNDSKEQLCLKISQNFPSFTKWFRDNYKH